MNNVAFEIGQANTTSNALGGSYFPDHRVCWKAAWSISFF